MIDRGLLQDLNFVLVQGQDYEVWKWEGIFRVHFTEILDYKYPKEFNVLYTISRKEFFSKFLEAVFWVWKDSLISSTTPVDLGVDDGDVRKR